MFSSKQVISQDTYPAKSIFLNRFQISFGPSLVSYRGDLQDNFNPLNIRPAFQVAPRYKYNPWVSQKLFLNVGWLNGSDKYSSNQGKKNRNLSFDAPFGQLGTQVEIYFLPDKSISRKNQILQKSIPKYMAYVFGGISANYTYPFAYGLNKLQALTPLRTEGIAYSNFSFSGLFGIGYELMIKDRWNWGLELGYNYTASDFIDDVSTRYPDFSGMSPTAAYFSGGTRLNGSSTPGTQRGNSGQPDGWFFLNVNFIYKFRDLNNPNAGVNCPKFMKTKVSRKDKMKSDPLKLGKSYSKSSKGKMKIIDNAGRKMKKKDIEKMNREE